MVTSVNVVFHFLRSKNQVAPNSSAFIWITRKFTNSTPVHHMTSLSAATAPSCASELPTPYWACVEAIISPWIPGQLWALAVHVTVLRQPVSLLSVTGIFTSAVSVPVGSTSGQTFIPVLVCDWFTQFLSLISPVGLSYWWYSYHPWYEA